MNLKKIRTEKGITIPKLVEQTGIPKRTVEDIQRRGDCLVSNAIKLADALGVTLLRCWAVFFILLLVIQRRWSKQITPQPTEPHCPRQSN